MLDYKNRYNDIISHVIALRNSNQNNSDIQDWIKETFPELYETLSEKIRKSLIEFFNTHKNNFEINGISLDTIIEWLEQRKPQEINTSTINKMVNMYSNTREYHTNALPLNCMIRSYKQGINDAINNFNLPYKPELDKDLLINLIGFINQYGDNYYSSITKSMTISAINDYLKEKYDIDINHPKKEIFKIKANKWYVCFKYYRFDEVSEFVEDGIYFSPEDNCLITNYGKTKYLNEDNYDEYFRKATSEEVDHCSSWFSDYSNKYS